MAWLEDSQNGDVVQPKSDIYTPTSTQKYRLGARYRKADGRIFHYARAGSTALVCGDLIQTAVDCFTANEQQDLAIPTASAAGDNWIWATIGTDSVTEDQCKDGYIVISDGSAAQGGGQIYQIDHHAASAAGNVQFFLYDKLEVLASTSAKAGLIQNPYRNVIQQPITTPTGFTVGVAPVAVTANYYFWLQTWGWCSCLNTGGLVVGVQVVVGTAVAGSCATEVAGASSVATPLIGMAGHTADDGDWALIYLQIAP